MTGTTSALHGVVVQNAAAMASAGPFATTSGVCFAVVGSHCTQTNPPAVNGMVGLLGLDAHSMRPRMR